MVSVICPTYNEERFIEKCIESILAQDFPKEELEIIFADGMSNDNTSAIISRYASSYPFIRLIDNPRRIVPPALNAAIREAHGDIIIRIDAHAFFPSNYISSLVDALNEYDADNVGAVCRTEILHLNAKTKAIKEVLSHPLGVGNSTFRTGITQAQEVDTVPFGCWRREVFNKYGLFDERLTRNQDIEFNKRIKRNGGRIMIVPTTYSIYYARETFRKLAKNNYGNGKWNILTVWYTKQFDSLSIRHFIPLIFVLSLILPTIASVLWLPAITLAIASLLCYLLAVTSISVRIASQKKLNPFYLIATFLVLHFSYGWGSLSGILALPFTKTDKSQNSK
ncbi:MAG: glycosyltransferase family 2 protein [Prevotella sp.]